MLGAKYAIRIGGCGALSREAAPGSILIVSHAVGGSGTARVYGGDEKGVAADPEIVRALERAAKEVGVEYRIGKVCTTDSYYRGQGRGIRDDEVDPDFRFFSEAKSKGIDGLEMESEGLFAVCRSAGIKVGSILVVHGNRITGNWLEDYEPAQRQMLNIAYKSLKYL
jgi:uridine phosphorylase